MKKVILNPIILCLLSFPILAEDTLVKAEIESLADTAANKLSELGGENQTIAVADFDNKSLKASESNMGHAVAEVVTDRLKKSKRFIIIENRQISKILGQLELEQTGLYDSKKTASVGNLVGAKFMVVGSISELGGFYNVSLRIVKIETGEVIVTETKQVPMNTLDSVAALYKPAIYRIMLGAGFIKSQFGSQSFSGGLDIFGGASYDLTSRHILFGAFTAMVTPNSGKPGYTPQRDTISFGVSQASQGLNTGIVIPVRFSLRNDFSLRLGYAYAFQATRILKIKPYGALGYSISSYELNTQIAVPNVSFSTPFMETGVFLTFLEDSPISFWISPGIAYSLRKFTYKDNSTHTDARDANNIFTETYSIDESSSVLNYFIRGGFMLYI